MAIRAIILGLIAGFILSTIAYFFFFPTLPQALIGRFLENDTVYMNSGLELRGRIVKEDGGAISIETSKGFYSIPQNAILKVDKGSSLRYLRKTI